MGQLFIKVLNLSIVAGWLVLAIVLLRAVFKRIPKWITCTLWALVALRLIFPFSLESIFSLIPSTETVPLDIAYTSNPEIHSGIPAANSVVNPVIQKTFTPDPVTGTGSLQTLTEILGYLWTIGICGMLIFALVSFLKMKRKVAASIRYDNMKDNTNQPDSHNYRYPVYESDDVESPFILGLFRPKIYIPSGMDAETLESVYSHESAHIKRRDYLWKPLGFLLLSIYWFNPLMWLAYILLCRDIEAACDEKVIGSMDSEGRAAYSQALLNCRISSRKISVCPLSFGETNVKSRVKSVLNYKKPAFWIIMVSIVACIIIGICFLTNPKVKADAEENTTENMEENTMGAIEVYSPEPAKPYEEDPDIGGKTYKCVGDSGKDNLDMTVLSISLYNDGTCTYTQPAYSSALPMANWYVEDNTLVIKDGTWTINYFDIEDGKLIYRKREDSTGFMFYNIADGEVFEREYSLPDKTYEYQPVVTFDDLNDTDYVFAWQKARFNNIMLKSYHHLENDPEKRVSIGLYVDNTCVMDFPKAGYSRYGTYIIYENEKRMEINFYDGSHLRLSFDIKDENWTPANKGTAGIPKVSKYTFNADNSSPKCEYLGLYDGMEFNLDTRNTDKEAEPYSDLVLISSYSFSEDDAGHTFFISKQSGSSAPLFTVSMYDGASLVSRGTFSAKSYYDVYELKEDVINDKKGLYLKITYGEGVNKDKTVIYEISLKDGIMCILNTSEIAINLNMQKRNNPIWNYNVRWSLDEELDSLREHMAENTGFKQYIYSGAYGLAGAGYFHITLSDDGSFSYSTGWLSSYIGTGKWHIEDNILVLDEYLTSSNVFYFDICDDGIRYRKQDSSSFSGYIVEDGDLFMLIG